MSKDFIECSKLNLIPAQYTLKKEDIELAWGNANFGGSEKIDIIGETLLKIAGGYGTGATALSICQDLGLVGKNRINPRLTKKGQKVMYHLNKDFK